jgi:hypothetical protein
LQNKQRIISVIEIIKIIMGIDFFRGVIKHPFMIAFPEGPGWIKAVAPSPLPVYYGYSISLYG